MQSLQEFIGQRNWVTDETIREKELKGIIEREIASLPAKMRAVFEMSRNENLSYKEIAEELCISDKTVKKQINNAIKILRKKINLLVIACFLCLVFCLIAANFC